MPEKEDGNDSDESPGHTDKEENEENAENVVADTYDSHLSEYIGSLKLCGAGEDFKGN